VSNIAIKGATTGTGTFTIESPATNTDRTLTLPDEAGTVLTTASNSAELADVSTGNFNPFWADINNAPIFDTDPLSFVEDPQYTNKWIRIGNQVYVTAYLLMPSSFSTTAAYSASANLQIGGLPFHSLGLHALSCGYFASWTSWSAGFTPMLITENGTGNVGLTVRVSFASTGGVTRAQHQYIATPSSAILFSGTYITGDAQ